MVRVVDEGEEVHHNRHAGNDAVVDGGGGPRGPTALRGAANNKAVDVVVQLGLDPGLRGVHGAHGALGHGEAEKPLGLVGVVLEVVPRVRNDGILCALLAVLEEDEVLVGDLRVCVCGCEGEVKCTQGPHGPQDLQTWKRVVQTEPTVSAREAQRRMSSELPLGIGSVLSPPVM